MWTRRASSFGVIAAAAVAAGLMATPTVQPPAGVLSSRGPQRPLDVLGYRIAARVGPDAEAFRAVAEITFRVTVDGTEQASFDLVGLTVDSVTVDGAWTDYQLSEKGLEVELGRRAGVGDTVVVGVFYGGAPEDGLIFSQSTYGRPTVFVDNWPNRARYWFPGIDHPSDKATVEFRVRAPAEWKVVAVGRLVEEADLGDGTKLWVWATDRPIPVYTMVFGAGELAVRELGSSGCEVETSPCVWVTQWTNPEDEETVARIFHRAPQMVAFFDSLIGPFPYEKLALVQSSTRFGGMENSSAIFLTERVSRMNNADGLLAHEIAHQWFGDAVTGREWPHIWLSEGFATYFEKVFFEFADGDSLAAAGRARAEARVLASSVVGRPVVDEEPENLFRLLNANSYQKGSWVLHMLRQVLGDEEFFAGIRRYYAELKHGTALSGDLQRVMEEVSGQELDWFFDQWLRQPGYPQVEVRWSWDAAAEVLRIRVRQVQDWDVFRFSLDIEAEGEGYNERRTFLIEGRDSTYEWMLSGEPQRVWADPDNDILGPVEVVR